VGGCASHADRVLPGPGDVDREPLLAEAAANQRRHLHLVLDDQDVHAHTIPEKMNAR
jgi:hypothetical protein